MESCLEPVTSFDSSFPIYHAPNFQILFCNDYARLTHLLTDSLIKSDINYHLFVDWTICLYHPLIFDLDINCLEKDTSKILLKYFREQFLAVLRKHLPYPTFTVLLAMRRDRSGGLRVHLPDIQISHDDYIHLCDQMSSECAYRRDDCCIDLDCPSRMSLVASDKPGNMGGLFVPVNLIRVDGEVTLSDPTSGLFGEGTNPEERVIEAARRMMPLCDPNEAYERVFYPTSIVSSTTLKPWVQFTSCLNRQQYDMSKGSTLEKGDPQPEGSFVYEFLKHNALALDNFRSDRNWVVSTWYKRFSSRNDTGLFRDVNRRIRKQCLHLKDEPNPLQAILKDSTNVLPIYYALCNEMKEKTPAEIAEGLSELREGVSDIVQGQTLSSRLTFDAILYCAYHTVPTATKGKSIFEYFSMGWDWILQSTTTVQQLQEHVKYFGQKFYPIVQGEESLHRWDPDYEEWFRIQNTFADIKVYVEEFYGSITFYKGYFMPSTLRIELERDSNWMESIIESIQKQLSKEDIIPNRPIPEKTRKDVIKKYGRNVPEYYLYSYVTVTPYD